MKMLTMKLATGSQNEMKIPKLFSLKYSLIIYNDELINYISKVFKRIKFIINKIVINLKLYIIYNKFRPLTIYCM